VYGDAQNKEKIETKTDIQILKTNETYNISDGKYTVKLLICPVEKKYEIQSIFQADNKFGFINQKDPIATIAIAKLIILAAEQAATCLNIKL
jgi:hypothetical protein